MGSLRIIAGEWKGRRIRVPAGPELRPTGERVREALFSILGERVAGARVLDAYAGTGALGLEALSRGAREVWFVEADLRAVQALQAAAVELGAGERGRVVRGEVVPSMRLGAVRGTFDLVFADPPWASDEIASFLPGLVRARLLAADGLLVVERGARGEPGPGPPDALSLDRTAIYGDTALDFYSCAPSG